MSPEQRVRLDLALVDRGLAPSRARARDAILRAHVSVDGKVVDKPAAMVAPNARLAIDDPAGRYVSRSGLKLAAALDAFGYSPTGLSVLDLGASTGGFSQVLLERGARHVTAVDVGHGQLHPRIAGDPRITNLENLNARDLAKQHLSTPVQAIVCDLSFISLKLALPPALALAAPGAWGVFLVKPQFEVGPGMIGKGGIVRDAAVAERAATDIADWLRELQWTVDGVIPSPIEGGDGNREFLIGARRG